MIKNPCLSHPSVAPSYITLSLKFPLKTSCFLLLPTQISLAQNTFLAKKFSDKYYFCVALTFHGSNFSNSSTVFA